MHLAVQLGVYKLVVKHFRSGIAELEVAMQLFQVERTRAATMWLVSQGCAYVLSLSTSACRHLKYSFWELNQALLGRLGSVWP
jgi:hypothetical protein